MPDQIAIRDAYIYCDRIARQRARNFYPAFRFLPLSRRLALSAFYTFCSLSDDVSDAAPEEPTARKRQRLIQWRDELERTFYQQGESPVSIALGDAIKRYDLPRQPFFDLLDGIDMDLEPREYNSWEDLQLYCRRVASSVGLVSLRIFGCTAPEGEIYADNLGIAFQLTNILRDVNEDFQQGRIYLPLDDRINFGITRHHFEQRNLDSSFQSLLYFEYGRARQFFNAADPALIGKEYQSLLPAEMMKAVYRGTLNELKKQQFPIFQKRVSLTKWQKIIAFLRAYLHFKIKGYQLKLAP
jgi:15-cis-phytoene synthase